MKHFLILLLIAGSFFCSKRSSASFYVDSIKVSPTYATRNDIIQIIAHITSTSGSINLDLSHQLNGNVINIEGCYYAYGTSNMVFYHHPITIGALPEGKYYVHFKGYKSGDDTNCIPIDSFNAIDSFVVHAPLSIPTLNATSFTIYPSPANNVLHINSPSGAAIQNTAIYDVRGALLRQYSDTQKPLDISGIPSGMYFLYIDTDKGRVVKRFLKE